MGDILELRASLVEWLDYGAPTGTVRVRSPVHCAPVDLCVIKYGNTTSFGWDVKPRSCLCSTPNMDYKDPDITEEENL